MALLAKVGRAAAEWRSRVNAAAIFLLVRDSCGRCWSPETGHWLWSFSDSSQGIFTETTPEEKCNL